MDLLTMVEQDEGKQLNTKATVQYSTPSPIVCCSGAGLKCESAKMTTSKMRKKLRKIFRILDIVIFALLHFALSQF